MQVLVSKEQSELLNSLQEKCYALGIPVLILFEGSSGRVIHRVINEIIRCLEPRGVSYHHFDPKSKSPRTLFDYLQGTPGKGAFSLFDRSWYSMIVDRYKGDDDVMKVMVNFSNKFEQYLVDNGTFVIKIILKATPAALKEYGEDYAPSVSSKGSFLSVDSIDPVKFRATMLGGLIEDTDTDCAPWNIIDVGAVEDTVVKAVETIQNRLKERLDHEPLKHKFKIKEIYPNPRIDLDLDRNIPDAKDKIETYSDRLYELQSLLAESGRAVVVCFEGWDAAGKGSAIKHLTHAFNPRGYSVRQVKSPTEVELDHTHLWRFCADMPSEGRITIFDRTWYGRMMVEPIEDLCTKEEYQRSAEEINEMEAAMVRNGTILIKFWLDISYEEQLARFEKRAADPLKQWKLTDEDWRNREKWDIYDEYVNQMIASTNTPDAPWTVIAANDKKSARAEVLKTVADRMMSELVDTRLSHILHFVN